MPTPSVAAPAVSAPPGERAIAQAQDTLAQRLDSAIAACYQPAGPGAAVIVVKDGQTLLRKAYGMADIAGGRPMTPGTSLRLGSVTKQFTAVAILMLAEEGSLSLDDAITRFFPDYPAGAGIVTIEHLLTHTSGISSFTDKLDYEAGMARDVTPAGMIDSFKNDPLAFEPGTRFHYNNSGYFLLGAIIERVSGQTYARFLEERIFVPLGMLDTAYEGCERGGAPRAAGYTWARNCFELAPPLSMTQPYAAGALVSTVDDLARWDAAISRADLLSPALWQRAFTAYTLADGTSAGYGYGWEPGLFFGTPIVFHDGSINGFASYAARLLEQRVFVAVLSNADDGLADPGAVAKRALSIVIGRPLPVFTETSVDAATLDRYAGVYEIDVSVTRAFRREGDAFIMQRSDGDPVLLKAFSQTGFFIPGRLETFAFEWGANGAVTAVTMVQDGNEIRQRRLYP